MQILDGKVLSAQAEEALKVRVDRLREQGNIPGLEVILVGEDPASQLYVGNKEKACARLGIFSKTLRLPETTTQAELEQAIAQANADPAIHGFLVQMPLPKHLDGARALSLIAPEKDADGFHNVNVGKLVRGEPGPIACTPRGVMVMLKSAGIDIAGKDAVVVGRSNIVGKPMAILLMHAKRDGDHLSQQNEAISPRTRAARISSWLRSASRSLSPPIWSRTARWSSTSA